MESPTYNESHCLDSRISCLRGMPWPLLKHLLSGLQGFSVTAYVLLSLFSLQNIYSDGLFYSHQLSNKLLLAKFSPGKPRGTF